MAPRRPVLQPWVGSAEVWRGGDVIMRMGTQQQQQQLFTTTTLLSISETGHLRVNISSSS